MAYLPDVDVISAVYEGEVGPAEGPGALAASVELTQRHGCRRLLSDCSGLEIQVTLFDVLSVVDLILTGPTGHMTREAVVLPLDDSVADRVRFYETACRNRGLNVRVFPDRESALAWLTE
jgi:hypothetical protein